MMEQAINVIYFLSEHPEASAENIIKRIGVCLLDKPDDQFTESTDKDTGKNWGTLSRLQLVVTDSLVMNFLFVVSERKSVRKIRRIKGVIRCMQITSQHHTEMYGGKKGELLFRCYGLKDGGTFVR